MYSDSGLKRVRLCGLLPLFLAIARRRLLKAKDLSPSLVAALVFSLFAVAAARCERSPLPDSRSDIEALAAVPVAVDVETVQITVSYGSISRLDRVS